MLRLVSALAAAVVCIACQAAFAADKVMLTLQWLTQCQFAGYSPQDVDHADLYTNDLLR